MAPNGCSFIVPATVGALALDNQREGPVEHRANAIVVGHAVGLAEHKRRKAMVIHIAAFAVDIEQSRGLGVGEDVVEGPLQNRAVFASARGMAVSHKRQHAHADNTQIFGAPIAIGVLGFGEMLKASIQ